MLEQAFIRDPSRANAAAVLPSIEQITRNKPRWTGLLARVLTVTNPAAAEARIGAYMADAAARADYWAATVAAGRLITLCQRSGRLPEALDLAGQMAEYTRQAGLGPWTQLGDEVERLQLLTLMGQADQVLDEVTRLRDYMDTLPTTRGPDEAVPPWNVREGLLDAGRHAALRVGQWADALAFNAEVVASLRGRRAPATSIARARFGDSGPLMRLGRTEEALQLLLDCRQAFQDGHDTRMLGRTLSALASIEKARSHGDAALRLEYDALRFKYLAADVTGIAISYHNLGNHLRLDARQPAQALASHLAAALIRTLTGSGGTGSASAAGSTRQATIDVRKFGGDAVPPHDVSALCRQVGDIPGTDLPSLIARLSPDPQTAEQVLGDLIAQAQSHA
jgi:hypothetical protein